MKWVIFAYVWFSERRWLLWLLLSIMVAGLALSVLKLNLTEDILDFFPKNKEYQESMEVFSKLNDAKRIVVIFEGSNVDSICSAIDSFSEAYPSAMTEVDFEGLLDRVKFVYSHIPYFLTEGDYSRLEQCFNQDSIKAAIQKDREFLSMPGMGLFMDMVSADPLSLVNKSKAFGSKYSENQSAFKSYNGYMMTADASMGFAFVESDAGGMESADNKVLVDSLNNIIGNISHTYPSLKIRLAGAPVVAVENADCIKHDTILSLSVSLALITILLLYSFPRKRDILLIAVVVGFGWLCGMAVLSLCFDKVSLIVLGIGGVLIGVAVNYPLHVLVHQRYTSSVKQTVEEIITPLSIGNITTVAAFAALVFLDAPAMRQLGAFASSMLIGTIVFCLFVLPHFMSAEPTPTRDIPLPEIGPTYSRILKTVVATLFVGALVVPFVIDKPLFDNNISNINYLTPQQRADFKYFESLTNDANEPAYLVSGARDELDERLYRWNYFWSHHNSDSLSLLLDNASAEAGFKVGAFDGFKNLISNPYVGENLEDVSLLTKLWPGRFDTKAFNAIITTSITDDFDFVGLVCSMVVFVFLCLCFRSVIIGVVAFMPMVLSWVFIVAIMLLNGIQFNIVNVILASFIFGQGDDYTIFIVEGLLYERSTGQKMLDQYKQSIVLSALVILIAMGTLVLSKHPAMFSLGAVTFVGMFSVLSMAIVVTPMLLNAFIMLKKRLKIR